jgi:hypothetical protein
MTYTLFETRFATFLSGLLFLDPLFDLYNHIRTHDLLIMGGSQMFSDPSHYFRV